VAPREMPKRYKARPCRGLGAMLGWSLDDILRLWKTTHRRTTQRIPKYDKQQSLWRYTSMIFDSSHVGCQAAAITAMILVVCAVAFYMTSPCRNPLSLFQRSSNIQLVPWKLVEVSKGTTITMGSL
jgi:hypothetical protein